MTVLPFHLLQRAHRLRVRGRAADERARGVPRPRRRGRARPALGGGDRSPDPFGVAPTRFSTAARRNAPPRSMPSLDARATWAGFGAEKHRERRQQVRGGGREAQVEEPCLLPAQLDALARRQRERRPQPTAGRVAEPTSRRVANASHAALQAGQARMCSMRRPRSDSATSPSSAAASASSARSHAGASRGSAFRRRTSASGARTERRTLSPSDMPRARSTAAWHEAQRARCSARSAGRSPASAASRRSRRASQLLTTRLPRERPACGGELHRHRRREFPRARFRRDLTVPSGRPRFLRELLVAPIGEVAEHDQLGEFLGQPFERGFREFEPLVADGAGVRVLAAGSVSRNSDPPMSPCAARGNGGTRPRRGCGRRGTPRHGTKRPRRRTGSSSARA